MQKTTLERFDERLTRLEGSGPVGPAIQPAMNSLIDMIKELELSFAAVTETWFKGGMQLKQELGDIEHATGVKFLYRNRDGKKN